MLKLETHDAFTNMAIDESIIQARINGVVPNTVRLYRWNPPAVSIGRFQNLENEVQLENCKKEGIDIVRRITGGGTVYHSSTDEITYSVTVRKEDLSVENVSEVYRRIYSGLVKGIQLLKFQADFDQGNDKTCPNLTIHGKKISGSAQVHRKGVVLQHGTLLLKVDLQMMFTLLRVPWAHSLSQVIHVAENRLTSLQNEANREMDIQEVSGALTKGFEKAFFVKLKPGNLTSFETNLFEKLRYSKYKNENWSRLGKLSSQ